MPTPKKKRDSKNKGKSQAESAQDKSKVSGEDQSKASPHKAKGSGQDKGKPSPHKAKANVQDKGKPSPHKVKATVQDKEKASPHDKSIASPHKAKASGQDNAKPSPHDKTKASEKDLGKANDKGNYQPVRLTLITTLKTRIKSLACKQCKTFFDSDREPYSSDCKYFICRVCFDELPEKLCPNCSQESCKFIYDQEILLMLNKLNANVVTDTEPNVLPTAENSDTVLKSINLLIEKLQNQLESRAVFGKQIREHSGRLKNVLRDYYQVVKSFSDCSRKLSNINEVNAITKLKQATHDLQGLDSKVDEMDIGLIQSFRLHKEEQNMQLCLNFKSLNFNSKLTAALSESKRKVWIVVPGKVERESMFCKLKVKHKSLCMYSARTNTGTGKDQIFINLKSFRDQKLKCRGFFLKIVPETNSKKDVPHVGNKEKGSFAFSFNNNEETRNVLLNKQVELLCTGERGRTYKGTKELSTIKFINITKHLPSYGENDESYEKLDLFTGIPDCEDHVFDEYPDVGDVISIKEVERTLHLGVIGFPARKALRYSLVGTIWDCDRIRLISSFKKWYKDSGLGERLTSISDCGAMYHLPS